MPQLNVSGPTFYSSSDEANFFSWLQSIPGVTRVVGEGLDLHVTLRSSRMGDNALREMVSLHWRYQLPMHNLAIFLNGSNERWFAAPGTYWHDAVFGATA